MTEKVASKSYVLYFDKDKPHHLAFFQALLDRVEKYEPEALQPGGDLNDLWRAAVETKAPMPANPKAKPAPAAPVASSGAVDWGAMMAMAKKAGAKFPELVAAQGALESNWYKSTSGTNNYFGLKGSGTTKQTKEFVNGKWVTIKDSFINFASTEDCVSYLVDRWYKDYKGYKGVNNAKTRDEAAKMLVKEGYATDPSYAEKLIRLMNENSKPASAPASPVKQNKPAAPPKEQEPGRVRPENPFTTRISANFTLGELALNLEARRFEHQYQVDTAAELVAFLERVRARFKGHSVIITSGYRPPAINSAVGGASNSEHLFNGPDIGAVDFYVDGVSIKEVQDWCDQNWPYSLGYGAPRGFVHLGIRTGRPRVRWHY